MSKLDSGDGKVRRGLRKVLQEATPTLRDIADDAGLGYYAVRLYRTGQRTPSPKVLRALVAALRGRSTRLAKLAAKLEAASKRE